ncbi:MAG: GyrI-like domain-containing protein [Notoacmeibacter sp.]|nr:GyrI-like domain-containing protein [Notoacmeibacter sp.]
MLAVTETAFDGAHLSVPQVVTRKEEPYVAIAVSGPMTDMPAFAPQKFPVLHEWMGRNGIAGGAGFFRYRRFRDDGAVEMEVATTTREPVAGEGEVPSSALPGGRYAIATFTGPYDRLHDAMCMLNGWIAGRGLAPAGEPDRPDCQVEIYRVSPADTDDPAQWVTELRVKIAD